MSTPTQAQTMQVMADSFILKDKKKKRRSRKSKQNSPNKVLGLLDHGPGNSSMCEIHVGEVNALEGVGSLKSGESNDHSQGSNSAFNLCPTIHINGETPNLENGDLLSQQVFEAEYERELPYSCPDPIVYKESVDLDSHGNPPAQALSSFARRKYFSPHWPAEVTREALEKGDVFRALFHVNAYNKLEAYCKIDGVQTDVLISGMVAQNRAVEGDIVAIKVDPPSLWIKMKGSTGSMDKAVSGSASTANGEAGDMIVGSIKGKEKLDQECHVSYRMNDVILPRNGYSYMNEYCNGEFDCLEQIGPSDNGYVNGSDNLDLDTSRVDCSNRGNETVTAVEKLCGILSVFPSKRPTGRVVGIIEKSPRRDAIVGFLAIKQWMRSRDSFKKDLKKNKQIISWQSREFLMLTPTDAKFSKMVVPFKSLPDCIKKRLEAGDATVEMDLVAAQIVDWVEENNLPEAHVKHSFGRGGEIEAQIAAIFFENAIDSSEFPQEAFLCLPQVPWEIPQEEFAHRRDLRNLCIFTIDPSTATDLDDALSVEKLSTGSFRVGVHIADISYFVTPDTALDIDAQIRSTTVYMLKNKLPMLPPLLSEHMGSLNPGKDRLAFSMFWDIDPAGEVLDRWIGRTIIRSCCKLSYEHAQCIIDGVFDAQNSSDTVSDWPDLYGCFEWSDVSTSVKNLYEISKKLKQRRFNGGALSLESPEVVFLFDEDGIPYDSILYELTESNFLVEEFMLLANQTAAEVISRAYPSSALLRKHPEPNMRKLREFEAFCSKNGLKLDISSSGQICHSLECIRGELKNDSVLFDILMSYAARPMQLAAYFCSGESKDTESGWGHYALAVPLYTHFTSPLRRYPDIVVHRTLAATLEAEEMYLRHGFSENVDGREVLNFRCFTSMLYVKNAVESFEAQEALSASASKYRVPHAEMLTDVAAHCNERKLASRHVKDATDKLYMWALLKKKQVLCLEARVLGLGPRFMSIYIHKLAVERRIYYDEVDGLTVEWLEATTTMVLSRSINKRCNRKGSPGKCRPLVEVALVVSPCDSKLRLNFPGQKDNCNENGGCKSEGGLLTRGTLQVTDVEPAVFPLTVRLLSTIPVALHAVGGDNGPVDIGARLYVSSYFGSSC